ncbi:MAG: hydrogenase iron-sulfur subunit [Desulfobulbaceae bacterium]|nr:hydrogenase iron-sulfur subunit [Desulfobulbaceae bacterium]
MRPEHKPKIIAFCCNWCGYAAADLAGIQRIQYPDSLRIIRVMCSGMVHPEMVLHALNKGADGVMIIGCQLGECHYIDGNEKAMARAELIDELLEDFGFENDRFLITRLSSSESEQFARTVGTMHKRVLELGPNPNSNQDNGDTP